MEIATRFVASGIEDSWDEGENVNAKNEHDDTVLMCASRDGRLDMVRALLKYNGVDVNMKNKNGKTVLDGARDRECDDAARVLEEHRE